MPKKGGHSRADYILGAQPLGGTYCKKGSGKTLHFIHLGINKYQNLDTGEIYQYAHDILVAHRKLHGGIGQPGNRPSEFTVTSGLDCGKKLSELPNPASSV